MGPTNIRNARKHTHLLDAEPVRLKLRVASQIESADDLLAEGAVAAFGKQCNFGMDLHSAFKSV